MRELIIAVGASGAGKSYTFSHHFANTHVEVSADNYFMKGGEYVFDPSKLSEAHATCKKACIKAMEKNRNVFVSNTSTKHWERKDYIALAKEYNYTLLILVFPNLYGNIHGVPDDRVQAMQERIDLKPGAYAYSSFGEYILIYTFDDYFNTLLPH